MKFNLLKLLKFLLPPTPSMGCFRVWQRNFWYFKKTLLVTFFWVVFEPAVNLLAIGLGLGSYVSNIDGTSYLEFFLPGLMCTTAMMISFFECTYGSFTKLIYQKTFSIILLTPISMTEILLGDLLWSSCKSMVGVLGVTFVASTLGLIDPTKMMIALPVFMIVAWFFSCFGLFIASMARNYDYFIYFISGVIVPMSLVSGTYFPLRQLPSTVKYLAYLLPLTHAVDAVRNIFAGNMKFEIFIQMSSILILSFILMNISVKNFQKRLQAE